jgi:hypothetical protein
MNTGTLQKSVRTTSDLITTDNSISLRLTAGIFAPNAIYTSLGFKSRKDGQVPAWVKWLDRVLRDGDKEEGIKSATQIFDEIRQRLRG